MRAVAGRQRPPLRPRQSTHHALASHSWDYRRWTATHICSIPGHPLLAALLEAIAMRATTPVTSDHDIQEITGAKAADEGSLFVAGRCACRSGFYRKSIGTLQAPIPGLGRSLSACTPVTSVRAAGGRTDIGGSALRRDGWGITFARRIHLPLHFHIYRKSAKKRAPALGF